MAKIDHLFVLMLENRSFDHMLGFSGIAGVDATSGARTVVEGLDGSQSNLANGQKLAAAPPAPFQMSFDPGHGFLDVAKGEALRHDEPFPVSPPASGRADQHGMGG